ncbi:MAG: hypothetical protein ACO24P_00070 [Candidatus Nanopelagicaceae bacterium]
MRSNTYPTQRTVYALFDFLEDIPFSRRVASDTIAEIKQDPSSNRSILSITVFDRLVMQVVKDAGQIIDIFIFSGFYYDFDGNPTKTTRERLNGLLDALGNKNIIPEGVRVIIDKEYGMCYVARGDEKIALNSHYCDMVGIKPFSERLIFGALDPTRDQKNYGMVYMEKQEV